MIFCYVKVKFGVNVGILSNICNTRLKYFTCIARTMANNDFADDHIKRLSQRIIQINGHNPGPFTLEGTNTLLIGTGKKRILVDTGEGRKEYIDSLRTAIDTEQCSIENIVITHWHHDHTGGIESILKNFGRDIKVWKYKTEMRGCVPEEVHYETIDLDKTLFRVEGATLRPIYTPGHTSDHVVLYIDEEQSIISGDTVLGVGTAFFQRLAPYMQSLQTILDLKPKTIYPMHGPLIKDGCTKVQEYISHRNQRELQIAQVLMKTQSPILAIDIVRQIYKDLDERLVQAATSNVILHLEKLQSELFVDAIPEELQLHTKVSLLSHHNLQIDKNLDGGVRDDTDEHVRERIEKESSWLWVWKTGTNFTQQSAL